MRKLILFGAAFAWCAADSLAMAASSAPPRAASAPSLAAQTRLIDVGGRRVAFHIIPGRPPAVIFESGGGMDSSAWALVLPTIYAKTGAELVTFDRPGFGDSDEDLRPPSVQHEVDDLRTGLSALGVDRNVVLVAHSFGGEVATAFVNQNPGSVARAVLVDASIPAFFTDAETAKMVAGFPMNMPQTDKQSRTMVAFFKAFPAMQHDFHTMHWPNSIPATVIISEHPPFPDPTDDALWTQDHLQFARTASNRSAVIAKGSGHIIMADRPDVVLQAVVAAVEQVRHSAQH